MNKRIVIGGAIAATLVVVLIIGFLFFGMMGLRSFSKTS